MNGKRFVSLGLTQSVRATQEEIPVAEFAGFRTSLLGPSGFGWSLTASTILHSGLIPFLAIASSYLAHLPQDVVPVQVVKRDPLIYQLSEAVRLVPPEKPAPAEKPKRAPAQRTESKTSMTAAIQAPRLGTRKFELPPQLPRKDVEQTILIPQLPPQASQRPEDIRLPNLAFWSNTLPVPRRPVRQFIRPGRQTEPTPPPQPIAPPKLEVPNGEANIADIKIAGGVAPKRMPILARAPSTTMPVQIIGPPPDAPATDSSLDVQKGEPVNMVTVNLNPAPPADTVAVPNVSQVGRLAATGNTTAAGVEKGIPDSVAPEGLGNSTAQAAATRKTSGGGAAGYSGSAKAGSGAAAAVKGGSSGNGGSGRTSAAGGSGGSGGAGASFNGSGVGSATAEAPGRMVHPKGGVFDMVVVQTSASDGSAEDTRLLTGKPIYSVYLRVGTPKEWILRFCVPKTGSRNTGSVVQLTAPSPVSAPYPLITMTPPLPMLARPVRTVLHGFLNAEGQFRDLAVVKTEDKEFGARLAPFLRQWEFRPATRDGKSIEVEVVLVIPALEI